jgi:Transcription antiterminator
MLARWFLVLTKSRAEPTARKNLERQGYRVYYPRLQLPLAAHGPCAERIVALFPRYLFVQVRVEEQPLGPVQSTLGVASVVRFGGDPAVVPDHIVQELRRREDPVTCVHRLSWRRPLERGSSVRIVAGAFAGLDGIFDHDAGSERVVILLNLLGREAPVQVSSRFVVCASQAWSAALVSR